MIDKKHAVQKIALTETMTLSLVSLIISYLLALSSSHFGHTSWPFADNSVEEIKSLPLIKVKCTTTAVTLHVSVIFWPQSRCSTVSQDVLHVIHHMNCCLPLPPAKKPSNVWLPIFSSKMWWQAANSKSLFKREIQIFGIRDIVIIVVCRDLVWEDPISLKSAHTCGE